MMRKKQKIFDLQQLVRPNIARLKPYSSARDEFKDMDAAMIFMDANENPYENGLNRYPDPHQRKIKKVLSKIKKVKPGNILLGNGSDEVLDLIFRAFCEPGRDNVIINVPTYGMYRVLADIQNIQVKEVLLTSDFQLDINKIKEAIDENTKLIFICSPNNPTGNSFGRHQITDLLDFFTGIVVIDEAYIDFSDEESRVKEIGNYPNLIVTQTFSKAYGLAGIRLGTCYADRPVIDILNKIKPPYNINQLTQNSVLKSLDDIELINKQIIEIKYNKNQIINELNRISFIKYIYPSETNFLLIKVDDADFRYRQLIGKRVVVRNRSRQKLCENCIRISIGTQEENQYLIKVLQDEDH